MTFFLRTVLAALLAVTTLTQAGAAERFHALSMYGDVKYPSGFTHFDYVNPDAPRGGDLKLFQPGSFDSLHPFISKGIPAAGLTDYIWDTLTVRSLDEPFTEYGLLAESMEMPKDRSWIVFTLREQARFADGAPVTAADVVFTFNALVEKGAPFFAAYYGSVANVEALDKRRVKFTFSEQNNRELPLIIGQLPVLPAHVWKDRDFSRSSLDKPLGSGPYRVAEVKPGKRIVYQRRDDYWARDLPVNRGRFNFASVSFEYFLDESVALEAFKGGAYDFRRENSAKNWATAYESPALRSGRITKEEIANRQPAGMQGFVYNLRRPLFQDKVLREALAYAMDFEWSNQNLFYGQYTRTRSYFQNSEMAATGLPDEDELALLAPYRDQLPEAVFTQAYQPPVTDGSGNPRRNLRKAQQMLKDAGYKVVDNQLMTPDGKPVSFEIMLRSRLFERVVLPFTRNLKILGVHADVRTVDGNQYIDRIRQFDYDMIVFTFPQSLSPGNEQRDFWTSAAADKSDSRNVAGIKDPVVDALVEKVIAADSRQQLITATRALDRVLQWGHYVIPHWHIDRYRVAYDSDLAHPEPLPSLVFDIDIWWRQEKD
jgi:microcin C transport system substrate-binding protein